MCVSRIGLCPKAYKEFCGLMLNADNVLLSYQRNALISSICGIGVISYRSQSHLARTVSNGQSVKDDKFDVDKHKPVTGICLMGLGFYFFVFGTLQYGATLRMLGRVFAEPLTKQATTSQAKQFLSSDLSSRFIFNSVVPASIYALSIGALFHSQVRQMLVDLTPTIVTYESLLEEREDQEENKDE